MNFNMLPTELKTTILNIRHDIMYDNHLKKKHIKNLKYFFKHIKYAIQDMAEKNINESEKIENYSMLQFVKRKNKKPTISNNIKYYIQ